MLRALTVALLALLAGCAAPPAAVQEAVAPADDDGVTVTATRVEPTIHWIDVHDDIESRPCLLDEGCTWRIGGDAGGMDYETPEYDFGDPLALFWRVAVRADYQPDPALAMLVGDGLRLDVFATRPCGPDCVRERLVASDETEGHAGFDHLDVYLHEDETGLRLRLVPLGSPPGFAGESRMPYHLHGAVGGYRAVADPVVVA